MWALWPGSYPSASAEEEFIAGFKAARSEKEPESQCSHCGDCGFLPPYSVDWETPCNHCNVYQEILLAENPPEPVRRREAIAATKQKHKGSKMNRANLTKIMAVLILVVAGCATPTNEEYRLVLTEKTNACFREANRAPCGVAANLVACWKSHVYECFEEKGLLWLWKRIEIRLAEEEASEEPKSSPSAF